LEEVSRRSQNFKMLLSIQKTEKKMGCLLVVLIWWFRLSHCFVCSIESRGNVFCHRFIWNLKLGFVIDWLLIDDVQTIIIINNDMNDEEEKPPNAAALISRITYRLMYH
jgi:hypothetical protein